MKRCEYCNALLRASYYDDDESGYGSTLCDNCRNEEDPKPTSEERDLARFDDDGGRNHEEE